MALTTPAQSGGEIAEGVHLLTLGPGIAASNVYFVRAGTAWVLVDAGWPGQEDAITAYAESLFGVGSHPSAIVLTHLHPDHSGSARELAHRWGVPIYVYPAELPMAAGEYLPQYANPLDRWLIGPILRLLPARRRARMAEANNLTEYVRGIDLHAGIPGVPGWTAVPTPGHTPGHVAYYRARDGILISGDAVLTVDLNSLPGALSGHRKLAGPPRYTTWNWPTAKKSIAALAALQPTLIAAGHGRPWTSDTAKALHELADHLDRSRTRRHRRTT